jgi:heme/copper-type cytochrome/quinol oxidase subunit 1
LNALGYWIYVASGIFLYTGFLTGNGPNDGWFNYVPYASRDYNPGLNEDFYSLGMVFLGISTTVGAANFIVTAFRTRAPGMSINRLPIMVWGTLTASAANLIVVPAVSLAFFLLWMDRQFGTHFFDPSGGGQPLLWQHLFWIFGHPWVYAIVLPAMGMVSDGLPVFCRRPLVGYSFVALSTVATMILGCLRPACPAWVCPFSPARRSSSPCRRQSQCLPGLRPYGSADRLLRRRSFFSRR